MKNVEEIIKNKLLHVQKTGLDGFMGFYADPLTGKTWTFVFSWSGGWEHLSVSSHNKTPSWDVMCMLKEIFWNDDEVCVEYHPKREDYVNFHQHCLHIWKKIDYEFPTPPSIFVGIKTGREHE